MGIDWVRPVDGAKALGEGELGRRRDLLVAEEDHQMVQQRLVERVEGAVIQTP